MKIIRHPVVADRVVDASPMRPAPWRVLVVDDEPDIRQMTALILKGFRFDNRDIELIEADSMASAKEQLVRQRDIALALIDVVMETDDAGLKLVEYIRNELGNRMIRLIIRTGQPGLAPERYVIDSYDIDDYKDKTELTAQKLYTTVRSGLKGYRDLQTIEINRAGLSRILEVTPELYNLHRDRLEDYFRGLLMQVIGICNLEHSGMISTIDGLVATLEGKNIRIRAGAGDLGDDVSADERRNEIAEICTVAVMGNEPAKVLRDGAIIVPLRIKDEVLGFIYLESHVELTDADRELIQIMANQCAAALDNFRLHHSLEDAYDEVIDMLAHVAEFKDSATGTHIFRIQEYTRRLALALGCSAQDADRFAKASRLHDVGKVGIPDNILRKPGKLTAEEFAVMKRHSRIGDAVLARSPSLSTARTVARSHHERWDGTGYPDGLTGETIPFEARLVSVVDVFDALVSQRPYKHAWASQEALAEIEGGRGTQFDPQIADAFVKLMKTGAVDDLIAAAEASARD